jgi:hypothetical protein
LTLFSLFYNSSRNGKLNAFALLCSEFFSNCNQSRKHAILELLWVEWFKMLVSCAVEQFCEKTEVDFEENSRSCSVRFVIEFIIAVRIQSACEYIVSATSSVLLNHFYKNLDVVLCIPMLCFRRISFSEGWHCEKRLCYKLSTNPLKPIRDTAFSLSDLILRGLDLLFAFCLFPVWISRGNLQPLYKQEKCPMQTGWTPQSNESLVLDFGNEARIPLHNKFRYVICTKWQTKWTKPPH